MDYAYQRYYAAGLGRFMTVDPDEGRPNAKDPSSWNRYTYGANDPANLNDKQGLYASISDSGCQTNGFDDNGDVWSDDCSGLNDYFAPLEFLCGEVLPIESDAEFKIISVLFGEDSWYLYGDNPYAFTEDLFMLDVMYRQTLEFHHPGTPQGVADDISYDKYNGYPNGVKLILNGLFSSIFDSECDHLYVAESAYSAFWSAPSSYASLTNFNHWVNVPYAS